jgi:hypothetical protein
VRVGGMAWMGVAVVRARMLKRVVRMAVVVRMVGEGWLVFSAWLVWNPLGMG